MAAISPPRALRLTIAEDSLLVREGLARILRDSGFDVVGDAAAPEQLLRLVERERPDAVLIDIRLPPTHSDEGLRAAAEIRRRLPSIALLVLSQYVDAEYALRLLEGNEGSVPGGPSSECAFAGAMATVNANSRALLQGDPRAR